MNITTRAQAITQGERYYYTGKLCANGHQALRYVSNFRCVECQRATIRRTHVPKQTSARSAAQRIRQEPYPCGQCPMFTVCAEQDLACDAFRAYIYGNDWHQHERRPRRDIFRSIFAAEVTA